MIFDRISEAHCNASVANLAEFEFFGTKPFELRLSGVYVTMRILCLHGVGASGAILRQQLDAFIREADPSYEFVFLDVEYECPPAPGRISSAFKRLQLRNQF